MDEWKNNTDVLEGDVIDMKDDIYNTEEMVPASPIEVEQGEMGVLTTPLSLRGMPVWLVYLAAILGTIYLLNPTAGFIELLPDNLPIVGNLDEGAAMLLIWYGLVEFFEGRKSGTIEPEEEE